MREARSLRFRLMLVALSLVLVGFVTGTNGHSHDDSFTESASCVACGSSGQVQLIDDPPPVPACDLLLGGVEPLPDLPTLCINIETSLEARAPPARAILAL